MKHLASGEPVCVSFALVDGLVLAKSLFHHSMNYRSAVVFGRGELLEDPSEIENALRAISDKIMPDRWNDNHFGEGPGEHPSDCHCPYAKSDDRKSQGFPWGSAG